MTNDAGLMAMMQSKIPIVLAGLAVAGVLSVACDQAYKAGQRSVSPLRKSEVAFEFDAATGAFKGMVNTTPFTVTNAVHLGNAVFQFQMVP